MITCAPYVPGDEWSAFYDDITEGWTSFLQQLRFMHELHPDAERRTIFLMGRGEPGVLERLLDSMPTAVDGVWYAAERQRGLLLPELGPGLLIAVAKDPAPDDSGALVVDALRRGDQLRPRRRCVRARAGPPGRLVARRLSGGPAGAGVINFVGRACRDLGRLGLTRGFDKLNQRGRG